MIHSLLLALALPSQGAPVHADLHPAAADVYVELGDVSSLLSALDGAPLLRFVRDERLKPLFDELGQSPERPLKELVQLGIAMAAPDAKPETWLDGLRSVSASFVGLGPGSDEEAPFALQLVAEFSGPEPAQALREILLARTPKHEPLSGPLAGAELLHRDKPAEDLWCAVVGSRLVVGNRSAKAEDYAARADKKLAGLTSRETFQKGVAALEKPSGTPLLWLALGRPLVELLQVTNKDGENDDVLSFLRQLPGDMNPLAGPRVARMQLVGERFVTEMVALGDGGASAQKPVDPAWLEPVSGDAMLVYSSAIDGAAAGREMRELLAKDEERAAAIGALEQKLGFGPERVLGRLGPGLTLSIGPPAGIGMPDVRAWVDCADPAAFTADFEALIGALGETLPGFTVKTKPYKVKKAGTEEKVEVPVTTVSLPTDMSQNPMFSVSPSFAPIGQRLVFSLNSLDVKGELKRSIGGEGGPVEPGTKVLAARGIVPPAEARSVLVMDWAKLLGSTVGLVKLFAGGALGFDAGKLPAPEMFTDYFKPTFHYTKPVAAGLYRRNEASFGPETWAGLLGVGRLIAQQQQAAFAPPAGGEAPVPERGGGGQ